MELHSSTSSTVPSFETVVGKARQGWVGTRHTGRGLRSFWGRIRLGKQKLKTGPRHTKEEWSRRAVRRPNQKKRSTPDPLFEYKEKLFMKTCRLV